MEIVRPPVRRMPTSLARRRPVGGPWCSPRARPIEPIVWVASAGPHDVADRAVGNQFARVGGTPPVRRGADAAAKWPAFSPVSSSRVVRAMPLSFGRSTAGTCTTASSPARHPQDGQHITFRRRDPDLASCPRHTSRRAHRTSAQLGPLCHL